jgi:hypothetical protein
MVHFKFVTPFSDKVYKCMREGLRKLQSMKSQLHTLKLKLQTDFNSNQTIDNNCATDLLFYKKSRNATQCCRYITWQDGSSKIIHL